MQWWYGHNAVAFFLTTPILGLMYYYVPKAADRPVYSYRLSILHFWSLVFIYIWAGPHHLHYTALPGWANTLGMLFSLMLWMPSWGGMINGLLTLRGAWHKVVADPILKFFVVAITFYGMSTFEGPLLSIKSVNALSHYTDWTIAHVHGGTLGWNGFMIFGMLYWLVPKMCQTKEMWNKKWVEIHFWIGTVGILLYIVPLYAAALTQGLMWRAFDPSSGRLAYPNFVETVLRIMPMYWFRAIGGLLYLSGMTMALINIWMTWRKRPATYELPVHEASPLLPVTVIEDHPPTSSKLQESEAPVANIAYKVESLGSFLWHRKWERLPLLFTVLTTLAVVVASLFEIIPTFLIKSNVPTISSVKPYTPLELAGRDIYIREGCYNCHSQMIRPFRAETERYGEYSKPGEFIYDRPFQWGSRRIGPDLHRVGGKYNHAWHFNHMRNTAIVPQSIMPNYPWLISDKIAFNDIQLSVQVMAKLGVPYSEQELKDTLALAQKQATQIANTLAQELDPMPIKLANQLEALDSKIEAAQKLQSSDSATQQQYEQQYNQLLLQRQRIIDDYKAEMAKQSEKDLFYQLEGKNDAERKTIIDARVKEIWELQKREAIEQLAKNLSNKEIVSLIAYLQRLGTDIQRQSKP
jgi:cytochrome c oxidase cbb3-type subunit I/II